jgi:sucrose-6-phosphate hydrolase SacC (GH32 family)
MMLTVSSSTEYMFLTVPRVRSDPYLREWSYVKPIFHAAARDPTEVWRRSDPGSFECVPDAGPDVYQLVVGTLNGTVLWQTSEPVASPLNADWIEVGVINHDDTGIFWECPDLFVLPGTTTWVSKHSLIGYGDFYQTGTFDGFSFTAKDGQYFEKQMYDTNPSFYASKSFYDAAKHRRVLWGWLKMNPWPSDDEADVGGWQNTQTVPRTITLAEDGVTLKTWPIEEIESLRKETGGFHGRNLTVAAGSELLIPLLGAMLDIEMNIQTTGDTLCGVRVLVDSEDPSSHVEVLTATSSLRVLVDASIVEAFFGHGPATTFFSSPKATSTGVSLVASGTSDAFCAFTVDVWEMCPFTFDVSLARKSVTGGQWV